jgi:type I restriction enzyme S subunit
MVAQAIGKGYKQTDVGVIPEDWQVSTFGDLFKFLATGAYTRSDLSDTGEINYIHYGDIHVKWKLFLDCDVEEIPFISPEKVRALPFAEEGDLVIADASEDYAGIGASVEIKNVKDRRIICGLHTLFLRGNREKIVDGYKAFLTSIPVVKNALVSKATGISVYGVSKKTVSGTRIPLPIELREQSAIAQALSNTNDLIESLNRLIKKKKKIKEGAMQELLAGKKRLSGFSDAWETKEIHRFADVTAGGTPSTFVPEYWGGNIRWMNSGELDLKRIYDVEGRITESGLKNSVTQLLPAKCILIGLAGQGKTRGTVAMNYVELCTNQSIAAVLPNDSFVPGYLYHNLDSRYNELRRLSTGEGGRGGLNLTILRNMMVALPPTKEEQSAIAHVLDDMDLEIEGLELKRDKYTQLKMGIMQQLLTGRIRLKWNS